MKLLFKICFYSWVFSVSYLPTSAQSREFVIGIYSQNTSVTYEKYNECFVSVPYSRDSLGNNTSVYNVLAQDGFTTIQTYSPNEWTSIERFKSEIRLIGENNMNVLVKIGTNFRPNNPNEIELGARPRGVNDFWNCNVYYPPCASPYSQGYFKHNIFQIMDIITSNEFNNIVWGQYITEESSYFHSKHYAQDCKGNTWKKPDYFVPSEVPVKNVRNSVNFVDSFQREKGVLNHQVVITEANHHKSIQANTVDHEGFWNPQDYLYILNPENENHIFFESSYTQFPTFGWHEQLYENIANGTNRYHYLGKFKSIDFAKSYGVDVHKVIASYVASVGANGERINYLNEKGSGLSTHIHSDPLNIKNANWLWFQAYTSIIHGVNGVWFWWLPGMWIPGEDDGVWDRKTQEDRFERQYFPKYYRDYLAHLARELALLKSTGFLNKSDFLEIASKTDTEDAFGIVPEPKTYIPKSLPKEKCSENYGLRYTLRSNGTEAVMIISNPLNTSITVDLDFSNIANSLIQKSIGVRVLFEEPIEVSSLNYKTARDANINLENANIGKGYYLPFNNKKLKIDFGPMDVHVLKFIIDSNDQNFTKKFFQLYPNPANEYVIISSLLSIDAIYAVSIYNSIGQKIAEQTDDFLLNEKGELKLETNTLASGTYFVQIKGAAFAEVLPLIIKR